LKDRIASFIISFLLFLSIFAYFNGIQEAKGIDPPATEWTRYYGGEYQDYGRCVVQTTDGGYAIAGETNSFGGLWDFYLVKTYPNGTLQWDRTYGTTSDWEGAYSLVQADDGGYAMAGYDYLVFPPMYSNYNYRLVKTDPDGNSVLIRTYGEFWPDDEKAYSIIQTSDGGYAMVGDTDYNTAGYYDAWLLKVSFDGGIQYPTTSLYGGTGGDHAYSVIQVTGDNYVIAGSTASYGVSSTEAWLIFADADGNPQWNQTYGGTGAEVAYSVIQTSDGGYALAGNTYSYGAGGSDFWLVKTDSVGNVQWNRTYGGELGEGAYSVVQTSDGGYALAGVTNSFGAGYQDFWLVRTDSNGNMRWNKTIGGPDYDTAYCMIQASDGGFVLAGYTFSESTGACDIMLTKIGPEIHDIAIVDVTLRKTFVGQGCTTDIIMIVENQGTMNETFDIHIRANKAHIGSITDISITRGSQVGLVFRWDTTGTPRDNYVISVNVTPVPGEADTGDNERVDGIQMVTIPGDVDGDRAVAVLDLFTLGKAYGSEFVWPTPPPNWNANCDIDNDFQVDSQDLSILRGDYGEIDV
jgi:hypothetical protein